MSRDCGNNIHILNVQNKPSIAPAVRVLSCERQVSKEQDDPRRMDMTKHRALILLDRSEFSRQILPTVQKLLSPQEYELILIHVADDEVEVELFTPLYLIETNQRKVVLPADADPRCVEILRTHQEALEKDAEPFWEAGYEVSIHVKLANPYKDSPVDDIIDFVEKEKVDLIAMTTQGRTGFTRLLFGSVAQELMLNVSTPILLLRPVR
jgi:nucleotide-binding universal stress UspA family protein